MIQHAIVVSNKTKMMMNLMTMIDWMIDSVVQDIATDGVVANVGGDLKTLSELLEIFESAVTVGREIVGEKVQ